MRLIYWRDVMWVIFLTSKSSHKAAGKKKKKKDIYSLAGCKALPVTSESSLMCQTVRVPLNSQTMTSLCHFKATSQQYQMWFENLTLPAATGLHPRQKVWTCFLFLSQTPAFKFKAHLGLLHPVMEHLLQADRILMMCLKWKVEPWIQWGVKVMRGRLCFSAPLLEPLSSITKWSLFSLCHSSVMN